MAQEPMISHTGNTSLSTAAIEAIELRIKAAGDQSGISVSQQLDWLKALQQFSLGRFLLANGGLNGYWTDYILTFPMREESEDKLSDSLEKFLLQEAPTLLATQQRFQIFLKENQKAVHSGATLACVPCGLMGELLNLDFNHVNDMTLVGIDIDQESLSLAEQKANAMQFQGQCCFEQVDAWSMNQTDYYDLISSNGLNIYEPNLKKVKDLYRIFFRALKPGGRLVTSFLTPPPMVTSDCEWDFEQINQAHLLKQKVIFSDILAVKWQCFMSSDVMRTLLDELGFSSIEIIYDRARLFPTVVAVKSLAANKR